MRVVKYIPIINIIVDSHSISEETYDLALKIDCGEIDIDKLTPIKVVMKDGSYILRDGRHRVTAFKLLGIKKIKAKFFKG